MLFADSRGVSRPASSPTPPSSGTRRPRLTAMTRRHSRRSCGARWSRRSAWCARHRLGSRPRPRSYTPSHRHTVTPSHRHAVTPSHRHTVTPSHTPSTHTPSTHSHAVTQSHGPTVAPAAIPPPSRLPAPIARPARCPIVRPALRAHMMLGRVIPSDLRPRLLPLVTRGVRLLANGVASWCTCSL